ncbi:unnamed protein product [Closterium sp. NIES-54]
MPPGLIACHLHTAHATWTHQLSSVRPAVAPTLQEAASAPPAQQPACRIAGRQPAADPPIFAHRPQTDPETCLTGPPFRLQTPLPLPLPLRLPLRLRPLLLPLQLQLQEQRRREQQGSR